MNIIEAVKSGRRFRRKGWDPDHQNWHSYMADIMVDNTDVIADDWEVEELSITLTRTQIERAYLEAIKETQTEDTYRLGEVVERMLRKLGYDE